MACGAKTRQGGECQKSALVGKRRCRLHGGASLSGKDHPNFQHGNCTIEARERQRLTRAEIQSLIQIGQRLGIFPPAPRRK